MNCNVKITDQIPLLSVINPQSATTAQSTGWVAFTDGAWLVFTLLVGAIAATGTVDGKLEQAQDSSGTGVKDVTGGAMTQLADSDDNKQIIFQMRNAGLDKANSFTHVRLTVTPAVAAALIAATAERHGDGYMPVTQPAAVKQIVTVV